jgi:hypothetical protein
VPVRHLLACVLASALVLTGCSHLIDGRAKTGPRDVDRTFFFADEVPLYGQTVGVNDTAVLAYLRGLRRIDVCGLLSSEVMARVGEINSAGTLFALNECDVDMKVSGSSVRKLVDAELVMTRDPGHAVAFRVNDTPVYSNVPDTCVYGVPLPMAALSGARPLRAPEQPLVKIGLIADQDCGLAQRIALAVAERVTTRPLPARDALAAYPYALAERDPCEAMTVVGADVDHWDTGTQQPYECRFSVRRPGSEDALALRVQLQPQLVDAATEGLERREQDGVAVYLDRRFCSALSFVGAPMQRRLARGGYVSVRNLVIRPAVVVDTSGGDCENAAGIAGRAAKLYA